MIKVTDSNNTTHNVIRLYKDGHEILKSYENDKLIYSPYILMGTIYASQIFTITSANTPNVTATFEILGQAGTDTDGAYYKFGMRLPDRADNDAVYGQSHFNNVVSNIISQLQALDILRSVDLYSTPFLSTFFVNRLVNDRNNTKFKEIDFKDFSVKNVVGFAPCTFAPALTTIRNLDKLDFKKDVDWSEAFRYLQNVDTFSCDSKSLYHISNLRQAFAESTGLTSISFALQDQNNTVCTSIDRAFDGCTNVNIIDIVNLRLTNLTNANGAFRNCSSLYDNPLDGVSTGVISQWQGTYENCSTLSGSQFEVNNYSGAVNMASCFKGCTGITSLDLSNQNLSNCANFDSTWDGCTIMSSLSLPSIKPTYMQYAFRGTALSNILANIDFSVCLNTAGMCLNCINFAGAMDYSTLDFSSVTQSFQMFDGCNTQSYTFKSGAFHNSTNMRAMFARNTSLTSIANLDMTSATNLNSMLYNDSNLVSVSGTAPSGIITQSGLMSMFYNCNSLETFPSLSNLKLANRVDLQGMFYCCYKFKSNPHFETWTSEDGISKPVISNMSSCFNNFGRDVADNDKFTIDLSGWTFSTKNMYNIKGSGFNVNNCHMPLINLDKIKIRPGLNASGVELLQNFTGIFGDANIEEVDTTTWLDNSDIPTLTKLNGTSNYAMFQYSQANTKLKKIVLKNVKVDDNGYLCNLFTFKNCNGVTHFECDIDFFNASEATQAFDISPFINWTNQSQISTFLTDLSTTQCRRYAQHNTPMQIKLSSNTYNVATSLSNWSTLSSAIAGQGWTITHA
jgi:hypothetical protein